MSSETQSLRINQNTTIFDLSNQLVSSYSGYQLQCHRSERKQACSSQEDMNIGQLVLPQQQRAAFIQQQENARKGGGYDHLPKTLNDNAAALIIRVLKNSGLDAAQTQRVINNLGTHKDIKVEGDFSCIIEGKTAKPFTVHDIHFLAANTFAEKMRLDKERATKLLQTRLDNLNANCYLTEEQYICAQSQSTQPSQANNLKESQAIEFLLQQQKLAHQAKSYVQERQAEFNLKSMMQIIQTISKQYTQFDKVKLSPLPVLDYHYACGLMEANDYKGALQILCALFYHFEGSFIDNKLCNNNTVNAKLIACIRALNRKDDSPELLNKLTTEFKSHRAEEQKDIGVEKLHQGKYNEAMGYLQAAFYHYGGSLNPLTLCTDVSLNRDLASCLNKQNNVLGAQLQQLIHQNQTFKPILSPQPIPYETPTSQYLETSQDSDHTYQDVESLDFEPPRSPTPFSPFPANAPAFTANAPALGTHGSAFRSIWTGSGQTQTEPNRLNRLSSLRPQRT